jgi:hypothetical protein
VTALTGALCAGQWWLPAVDERVDVCHVDKANVTLAAVIQAALPTGLARPVDRPLPTEAAVPNACSMTGDQQ